MSRIPLNPLGSNSLGDYLREQRQTARLSLRQLSELAGVSNPYLSQIERGLKRPSAEILQQLAKGLEVSAESLYVRAGILDERHQETPAPSETRAAISADALLSERQKAALLDIYDSFVAASTASAATTASASATDGPSRTTPQAETAKHPRPAKARSTSRAAAAAAPKAPRTTAPKTITPKTTTPNK